MAKKGGPVQKVVETIYKLALDKSFRADIRAARIRAGIPADGFANEKEEWGQLNSAANPLLLSFELTHKYKLPLSYYWEMGQYLRFDSRGLREDRDTEGTMVSIQYPGDKKNTTGDLAMIKKLKVPYVGVYIHDASSRETIIKYVRKHWVKIRKSLEVQGGNTARIRTSLNKERNLLISILNEKTRDELWDMAGITLRGGRGMYKESVIAQLLREKYGFKQVTIDMVKKYIVTPKRTVPTDKLKLKRSFLRKKK